MEFEWDEAKNRANQLKHQLSFSEAALILEGDVLTFPDDREGYGEGGVTRLISARLANRRERRLYHDYFGKADAGATGDP